MDDTLGRGAPQMLRMLLFGVLAALAFVVLSFFASASSASADEGSGLLGAVGSTVETVADTGGGAVEAVAEPVVEPVVETASPVVESVVEPVAQVVEPVTAPVAEVLPAPVAEVVTAPTEVVPTVVDTVNTVGDVANDTVSGTVGTVGDVVSGVAGSGLVGGVIAPVVDTVESLPVVGAVVESTGLGGVVTDVAVGVDETLPVVVGELPSSVAPVVPTVPGGTQGGGVTVPSPPSFPGLPIPGAPSVSLPGASVADLPPAVASVVRQSSSPVDAAQLARLFRDAGTASAQTVQDAAGAASITPSSPADRGASSVTLGAASGAGAAISGSSATGGAAPATADHGALSASLVLLSRGGDVDDDIPAVPVYATDVSPD